MALSILLPPPHVIILIIFLILFYTLSSLRNKEILSTKKGDKLNKSYLKDKMKVVLKTL